MSAAVKGKEKASPKKVAKKEEGPKADGVGIWGKPGSRAPQEPEMVDESAAATAKPTIREAAQESDRKRKPKGSCKYCTRKAERFCGFLKAEECLEKLCGQCQANGHCKAHKLRSERSAERPRGAFIEARFAEEGRHYVNWSLHAVLEFTGQFREKRSSDGTPPVMEPMFRSYHDLGDLLEASPCAPHFPIRVDDEMAAAIMVKYEGKRKRAQGPRQAPKMVEVEVEEVDETTGEKVKVTKMVAAPKKTGKPRGDKDPRTGCTLGSDAHAIGIIMLEIKPCKDHRVRAVDKIVKDLGKPKALAQSWYSTHQKRKPEIYGKLQVV